MRLDATIEGGQQITIGTIVVLSYDWREVSGQTFSISTASAQLFDEDNTEVIASTTAEVTSGINLAPRTQVTFTAVQTSALTVGSGYYVRWTLVLGDGQTRIVRGSIYVRNA